MSNINILRCICDETRIDILSMLQAQNELCVNDFVTHIKKDQPLISHHLKRLRECGIITSRSMGKKMMYRISNAELAELIEVIVRAGNMMPNLCENKQDNR